ncbi:hypothetical protein ACFE04_000398 [Oxalis oulophora]
MGLINSGRTPNRSFSIFLIIFTILFTAVSSSELILDVGQANNNTLRFSSGVQVKNSPGTKPGAVAVCQRVHLHGLSRIRIKDLSKFAHSVHVKVSQDNSSLRMPVFEVCFHRNASLGIGMCSESHWKKSTKGSWTRAMSPFEKRVLDVRMAVSSLETLEVSIVEEFFLYRVVFLIVGIALLSVASPLSRSLVFYYSSAMAVGVLLVVLVILFQGMKLLPTGRRSSLAVFMYASMVGLGSFLLQYVPGLIRSVLVEIGISEDMYNPVCKLSFKYSDNGFSSTSLSSLVKLATFLVAFVVLAGAWLGFWVVRKFVLAEDGTVDTSTSQFVAWSIRIVAAIMIIQSSFDPLLGFVALLSGIAVSTILRKTAKIKVLRRVCRKLVKLVKRIFRALGSLDFSSAESPLDDYLYGSPDISVLRPRTRNHSLTPCNNSTPQGFSRRSSSPLSETGTFPSTFHSTPERRKISKAEWDEFTKVSTQKAVVDLVSSPDFRRWIATNADRITVTPTTGSAGSSSQPRRWFSFF